MAESDSAVAKPSMTARRALAVAADHQHSFFASRWLLLQDWLAKPQGSNLERTLAVVIFALIVMLRQPRVILTGRFWGEEGNVFFPHAWNLPWEQALFMPFAGYLNLVANLGGVLARYLAPLWAAPYVTTGLGLLTQCIPAVLLVTSRAKWLQHRVVVGAALLMIAMMRYSIEISLSTLGSQFFLALAVALILALELRSGALRILQWFVLLLAPLSGPASWALLPLFAIRALVDRSRERLVQTCILGAGVMLQAVFFFGHAGERYVGISPSLFGAVVLAKHVITPFLQGHIEDRVTNAVAAPFTEAGGPLWPLAVVAVLAAAVFVALARLKDKGPLWMFSAGVAMATISYCGALGGKLGLIPGLNGGRYALAPQVLFELCLLSWCVMHRGSMRFWSGCAFAWLIVASFLEYRFVQLGPPWRPEVRKWEQDHSYVMKIWPPGWTMTLSSQ